MPYTASGGRRDSQAFPYRQVTVLSICRISEPIAFMSIFPYIYYMVKSFHITEDDKQISFYAGLVISAFALGEAMSSSIWGRLSDKFGRKPILLTGLGGTGLSMLIFGFAQNLQTAMIARALGGLLNGNIGVIQTTLAEVVKSEDHQAMALSIMPTIWCVGAIIGSILGGTLADPVQNHPEIFQPGTIWERFPYLLPNLVSTTVFVVGIIIGILFLEETHPDLKYRKDIGLECGRWIGSLFGLSHHVPICGQKAGYPSETFVLLHDSSDQPPDYQSTASSPELGATAVGLPPPSYQSLVPSHTNSAGETEYLLTLDNAHIESASSDQTAIKQTSSVWHALNMQLALNIIGYGILAYHTISAEQLLPVLFSLPESDTAPQLPFWFTGGFALSTKKIGGILSLQGAIQVVAALVVFPPVRQRLGTLTTFRMVVLSYPLLYILVPYLTLAPVNLRMPAICAILVWKVTAQAFTFPCIQIMLANSTPRRALGTFNGIAQSSASFARAIGPSLSGLLEAAGLSRGMLGLPWWFNACVALVGAALSLFVVEQNRWPVDSEKHDLEESDGTVPSVSNPDHNAALVAAESTPDSLVARPASPILVRLSMDIRRNARRNSKA